MTTHFKKDNKRVEYIFDYDFKTVSTVFQAPTIPPPFVIER